MMNGSRLGYVGAAEKDCARVRCLVIVVKQYGSPITVLAGGLLSRIQFTSTYVKTLLSAVTLFDALHCVNENTRYSLDHRCNNPIRTT